MRIFKIKKENVSKTKDFYFNIYPSGEDNEWITMSRKDWETMRQQLVDFGVKEIIRYKYITEDENPIHRANRR